MLMLVTSMVWVPKPLCLLQVLVCIFLWLIVDVIKTMAAKLMAGHFHQETYFQRMQEALRKVLILWTSSLQSCLQPVIQCCIRWLACCTA